MSNKRNDSEVEMDVEIGIRNDWQYFNRKYTCNIII